MKLLSTLVRVARRRACLLSAIATVVGLSAMASPAQAVWAGHDGRGCIVDPPQYRPQVVCTYNVYWLNGHCNQWVFYGTFQDQCSADRAVEFLRCNYRVQAAAQASHAYTGHGGGVGYGGGHGYGHGHRR